MKIESRILTKFHVHKVLGRAADHDNPYYRPSSEAIQRYTSLMQSRLAAATQYKHNRIPPKEHLANEAILVDRFPALALWCLCPHLLYVFQNLEHAYVLETGRSIPGQEMTTDFCSDRDKRVKTHHVGMTVKRLDAPEKLVVIA
jgi:hypothetical protein